MDDIVRFIHEAGSLKLVPRSGWLKLGIKLPESVAEHSFRTALIAFILALKSGEDMNTACRACAAALFHDIHESRTMDLHKIAKEYASVDEEGARRDQLPFEIDFGDVEKYVKDADRLELAFQAVEYAEIVKTAIEFAEGLKFETDVARNIYELLMEKKDPRWWRS